MTVRWTVRAAEDRARSSRENRVPAENVAKQHKNTASPTAFPATDQEPLPYQAHSVCEQLTLNLPLGE